MKGLGAFHTRNLLTYVVPAIITFLSLYWFRKRRKLKTSNYGDDKSIAEEPVAKIIVEEPLVKSMVDEHLVNGIVDEPLVLKLSTINIENSKSDDQASIEVDEGLDISTPTDDGEIAYDNNGHDDCPESIDLNSYFYIDEAKERNLEMKKNIENFEDECKNCSAIIENNFNTILLNSAETEDCDDNCLSAVVEEIIASPVINTIIETNEVSEMEIAQRNGLSDHEEQIESFNELIGSSHAEVLEFTAKDVCNDNVENIFCPSDSAEPIIAESTNDTSDKIISSSIDSSPISRHQDASSDCDAPSSSIGSSSISLSDLSSTSPVDSVKEQTPCHPDSLADEDVSITSGIDSIPNLNPTSSSSLSNEFSEVLSVNSQRVNFRYSCRKNADVLCKEVLSISEQCTDLEDQSIYRDSECNSVTHRKDGLSEIPNCASNLNSSILYTPVIDSKTFQLNATNHYIYEFEMPQELCGRLIGRQGKHVRFIKEQTNATVYIKRHPFNPRLKVAVIEGTRCDVNSAMELLQKRFPPSQFPNLSLAQTNAAVSDLAVPESLQVVSSFMGDESNLINRRSLYFYYLLPSPSYIFNNWLQNFTDLLGANSFSQLQLPENTSVDVVLSSTVNAGHFFLQQPTHPTYPSLSILDQYMMTCYSQTETPQILSPPEAELVCAATIMGGWYRAQVASVSENGEECEIRFVDYGGYLQVPTSSLRQIRSDFTTLPFQASECYLANVQPINAELSWSSEASKTFEELAQGQILQAVVINYHENGVPNVYLYRVQGVTSTFINQELVSRGFAKWIDQ